MCRNWIPLRFIIKNGRESGERFFRNRRIEQKFHIFGTSVFGSVESGSHASFDNVLQTEHELTPLSRAVVVHCTSKPLQEIELKSFSSWFLIFSPWNLNFSPSKISPADSLREILRSSERFYLKSLLGEISKKTMDSIFCCRRPCKSFEFG